MKIKQQSTKTLKEGIIFARYMFVIIYFILIFLAEILNIKILILFIFILSMCERWIDRNVIMLEIRDNKRW